jgi:hypothetical protein
MPRTFPFETDTTDSDPGLRDPDHHLWRNGRLYWVAFTVHLPGWRKERVRLSLGTADLHEARRRRDAVLRGYPGQRGCALSLRIAGQPFRAGDDALMRSAASRGQGCAA